MPSDADRVLPFAGLTRHDDATGEELLPDAWGHGSSMRWWVKDRTSDGPDDRALPGEGLNTIIDQLPRASTTAAGWRHPVTGEWVETTQHNAVVNPMKGEEVQHTGGFGTVEDARNYFRGAPPEKRAALVASMDLEMPVSEDEFAQAITAGDDALYYIPTDSYTIINPSTSLHPLVDVLRERDLGRHAFGEFRLQRGGGRVSADILFDGKHVELPEPSGDVAADGGDRAPVCVGLELSYDFFGDTAFRARGLGMDFDCANALRGITEWSLIKHSGDVEERVDWTEFYEGLLEEINLLADQLSILIAEASALEFDLSELPADFMGPDHDTMLDAFFEYAGFPEYLAETAARNVQANADDPFEPNWWELHRGATFAITHEARGEVMGGGAIDRYNHVANDMLMQPGQFEETVQRNYELAVDARDDDEALAAEGGGEAAIETAFEPTREKKSEFEERAEELQELRASARE
jgi:hypothetical protein